MSTLSPTLATDASPEIPSTIITMTEMRAVLKVLADRRDPYGTSVASLTISKRTIEVLNTIESLVENISQAQAKRGQDHQRGVLWTSQEDQLLRDAFLRRELTATIAERHQRTTSAIRSRMVKLGLLNLDDSYA
jgi:hypothetical protein